MLETTQDTLLQGSILLHQPKQGYRTAIDPLFLAAAIPESSQHILEVGTGTGAALLCLAHRLPHCQVKGLENHPELAHLADQNIALNKFEERAHVIKGDLLAPPAELKRTTFDHVMANPPYHPYSGKALSSSATKAGAHQRGDASLADWVKFCAQRTAPKGKVTFIYTAERIAELISCFQEYFGGITLYPLWPKQGTSARRILIQGRKHSRAVSRLLPGLVLHNPDGSFTPEAQAILQHGQALDWK